jgi:small subunit ribosomal protein S27Ae
MSAPPEAKPEPPKAARKRVSPQVWKFFRVQGDKVIRLRHECPRCGRGAFLAEHADRSTCGRCGFTQFKRKE